MMYFLDTNTCIDFLRGKNTALWNRFNSVPNDDMKIPTVVKAELLAGALKSRILGTLERTEQLLEKLRASLFPVNCLIV
jgi:tRNA(fMet)-specific endonuclease VapC